MLIKTMLLKVRKIPWKITLFRLRPIEVFLFHQVSDKFDEDTMYVCDWTEIEQFKRNILALKKEYKFISLEDAYTKLRKDVFRRKKFAVLTSDDGWSSLKNIIPWLDDQGIPVTLFLNPCYFDGKHFREKITEKYLLSSDIRDILSKYSRVTIGTHGWEHVDSTLLSEDLFKQSVVESVKELKHYGKFVPFYCYTWGRNNPSLDSVLNSMNLIPVMIDGTYNVKDDRRIHRRLLDGVIF